MLKFVLYGTLFLTFYTYIIFPILLFIMSKIVDKRVDKNLQDNTEYPSVAIICAMYNEGKMVQAKIENFLRLDYNDLRLYIGSDGSTDQTNELLRQYANKENITFIEFPRRGKVYVINDLIAKAQEDIIVFTDANSMFEPNAITSLVKYFSDPQIGAVCGRLKLVNDGKITGEGFYWQYETLIKRLESNLNCVIGANGAIFGVLRHLLKPLPLTTINDDFMTSMRVAEQGYGIKYAPDAIAYEEVSKDDAVEFKRHVRDGAGHYRAMVHLYRLLNPLRIKLFFLYVSHRVLRWLVPFFLIILLLVPLFCLKNTLVRYFYYGELFFYLLPLIGWVSETKIKIFYIPYYFIYVNVALLLGFLKNITGTQKVMWNSTVR